MLVNGKLVGSWMQLCKVCKATGYDADQAAFPMLDRVIAADDDDKGEIKLDPKQVKALLAELKPFRKDSYVNGFMLALEH
jgi:hypothetical protein